MSKIGDFKKTFSKKSIFDIATIAAMAFGVFSLLVLLFFYLRPLQLADIRVPVATTKASYAPSDQVGGIFFGEVFYTGNVKVLREVFCTNYKRVMKPPAEAAVGDFFATQSSPRVLEGNTIPIGALPDDVPIGENCIIRFTNVYDIPTPFGTRNEEIKYYTQNFTIVGSQEREDATERDVQQRQDQQGATIQSEGGGTETNNETSNQNPPQQPPSEPVDGMNPPEEESCTINTLGIKLFCD